MLLDVMSSYNYVPVNTKAIKLFGLPTAAYFAVLADIYPRVVSKKLNELMNIGYFTVDRSYVESKCGLSPEEQYTCDLGLERVGVVQINPQNRDMIGISMDTMFACLAENDVKLLDQLRKKAKTKKTDETAGKRAGQVKTFSAHACTLTHVPEVQEAFRTWVTAMVESGKAKMSKAVVELFYNAMSTYTQDPAVQCEILRQATMSGYTNAEWVISSLSRTSKTNSATRLNAPQKEFAGVDDSETF